MKSAQYIREVPQRYRLEAGQCTGCGRLHFPPRLVCDGCGSREFEAATLPRQGTLLTWTVIHAAPPEYSLETPYVVGIVELAGGVRLTCQVADCNPEELAVDAPLELVFRRLKEDNAADIIQYGYKAVLKRE